MAAVATPPLAQSTFGVMAGPHRAALSHKLSAPRQTTPLNGGDSAVRNNGQRIRPVPTPLNLTYALHRTPSHNGGALVSPVYQQHLQGSPLRGSPRTPSFNTSGSGSLCREPSFTRRRPSTERGFSATPTSASFAAVGAATRRYSMPSKAEQDNFEQLCKARFYDQDAEATLQIESILKNASVTAQSCFNKILSTVRQKFHSDVTAQRQENLRRILSEAVPDPELTKEDRRARLKSFLEVYSSKEVIGTHPFLQALYTVMYLQSLKETKGGAGANCIDWALQDEVFMEAGTGQWTQESVSLLKTVLAMSETSGQVQDKHNPFSDDHDEDESALDTSDAPQNTPRLRSATLFESPLRTLRFSPALANPEIADLLALFPVWIASPRARSYRLPIPGATSPFEDTVLDDAERAVRVKTEKTSESNSVRISHGRAALSSEERHPGFEGTIVERVTGWIRRLFRA